MQVTKHAFLSLSLSVCLSLRLCAFGGSSSRGGACRCLVCLPQIQHSDNNDDDDDDDDAFSFCFSTMFVTLSGGA